MSLKKPLVVLTGLLLLSSLSAIAQTFSLSGVVMDKSSKSTLVGVIVILKELPDTTVEHSALTDNNGRFVIHNLRSKAYRLNIQNISYKKLVREVAINNKDLNLGVVELATESKELNEVVVVGQGPAAVQKGDTTEMSSSAYKTNPDANAEDLVKKMPGITVENGTLKAQGEEVKKVLVDGKQFFGDDPSIALKNLPAEVIDKVQVFNKLSEQSELTGVDDGNSTKTINIVTKQNRRTGQFGKFIAGTDFDNKYLLSGNLNSFKGGRRISLIGTMNNINQQNFSAEDLLGSSGGGRGGNMGGGNQSGVTKTKSIGLNYTNNLGKKVTVNGSYFFNSTNNTLIQESNTENLFITDGKYSKTNSNSTTKNYNHRLNMRIEYNIDSANTLLFMPRISTQSNDVNKSSLYNIWGGIVNSSTNNLSYRDAFGYNLSNEIVFRHKFSKPRRTLSFGLNTSMSDRETENTQYALVDTLPDNQYSDNNTNGFTISANATYTEPVTTYGMLMLRVSSSHTKNETDKETFRLGDGDERLERLDSLSNVYDNTYNTNRAGLSYVVRKGQLNLNFGAEYQRA
ncbi:MAG TPA: carboxypeptidase-like regulatory domain-containing protein, partial [Bacteroidales bacterium]|nr:carboxypeptidase-like regulatory domain-containing protein [Bacteroidales bacterium]